MHIILPVLICTCDTLCDINVGTNVLAVSKSLSLLRTVPRVPGNISILGIKLSDQIRKTYCLTVMIPDFVWFLYGLIFTSDSKTRVQFSDIRQHFY